jgi:hypothetical protein
MKEKRKAKKMAGVKTPAAPNGVMIADCNFLVRAVIFSVLWCSPEADSSKSLSNILQLLVWLSETVATRNTLGNDNAKQATR